MKANKIQRNWQTEELRTMLLVWNMAEGSSPNSLISDTLKRYGYLRTMAQIERKKNEFFRAYTLVKPHAKLLDSILKNEETKGVETSDKGPTCSVKAQKGQGDAANEETGKAANTATKDNGEAKGAKCEARNNTKDRMKNNQEEENKEGEERNR